MHHEWSASSVQCAHRRPCDLIIESTENMGTRGNGPFQAAAVSRSHHAAKASIMPFCLTNASILECTVSYASLYISQNESVEGSGLLRRG